MPLGQEASIRGMEVAGETAPQAEAGDSVDLTLSGLDAAALQPGMAFASYLNIYCCNVHTERHYACVGSVLCAPESPIPLASIIEARLLILDGRTPILQGHQVRRLKPTPCLMLILG